MAFGPTPATDGVNTEPATPVPLNAPPPGVALKLKAASDKHTTGGGVKLITGYAFTVRIATLDVTEPQPEDAITLKR